MRNLLILLLALMLGAMLPGCRRTPSPRLQAMSRAEALMDSFPDSALAVMRGLSIPAEAARGEHALYALLLTQALDKNYIDVADDSLIAVADEYYRTTSDTRRQMLSAFYRARVRFNALDYPRSLRLFTESLELAAALSDPFWQARAASEIAEIYKKCHHRMEAARYAQMSYDFFRSCNAQPHLNYALLEVGRAYHNIAEDAKAEMVITQVVDSALCVGDTILLNASRKLLAHSYAITGQYDRCLKTLKMLSAEMQDLPDVKALFGESYLGVGEMDSARMYLPKPTGADLTAAEYQFLYEFYKKQGDYKRAMVASDSALRLTDRVLSGSLDQTFAQSLHDYYSAERQIRELKLRNSYLSNIVLIVLFVIFMSAMVYGVVLVCRRHRQERAKFEAETAMLRKNIEEQQKIIHEKQSKLQSLLSVKYDVFNRMCQVYYENQGSANLAVLLSETVKQTVADFSDEDKTIAELGQLLDEYFDNIFTHLRQDFPKLKIADQLVFVYSAVGFSTGPATMFLKQHKPEYYYNHRTRLKARINKSDSPFKAYYLAFLK